MERMYPSVTLENLTPRAFASVPIRDEHLDWVTMRIPNGLYVTYLRPDRIETLALNVTEKRFLTLERSWSASPLITESGGAEDVDYGWRRTHLLDRFPPRSEMLLDAVLTTPSPLITAHYTNVPDSNPLPKNAHAWRTLERSRTH